MYSSGSDPRPPLTDLFMFCPPQGLTLDPPSQTSDLQMMVSSLGIPPAPVLKPPSETFTLMKEAAHLVGGGEGQSVDLASRLHGIYEVQVAAHLTLTQLRSFCHDLVRSLRAVAAYQLPGNR
ncbi:Alanine--tRNA ligase [Dissostichus eleginoides]|uniref:Alanine--tRNA ligase n=1 Tax=Dissostichus eleginoides TaxID=100907 RepID=A0AAD9ENG2_DISEL|nr:Alanine--tRNA ligase [Dissostichus eleginoides]